MHGSQNLKIARIQDGTDTVVSVVIAEKETLSYLMFASIAGKT